MLFTQHQLQRMREEYSRINKINPDSYTYTRLIQLLDSLPQQSLVQLSDANIKFVSKLASNRVNKESIYNAV